ncbi:glycosyltransferase [Candidatus Dojkabacteria bacterium]|jgi:glycosyltransferase involved in cell wall biosynthesis|nr:glycosyltransferase [Candidatus Dojkabacteria bacterium]
MRIAVFAPNINFVMPVVDTMKEHGHEVRLFYSHDDITVSKYITPTDIFNAINWCDIAFFEWASELLVVATKNKIDKPVFCRIHSDEVIGGKCTLVNWNNVDGVIFVGAPIRRFMMEYYDITLKNTAIIPIGVDTCKFNFGKEKPITSKIVFSGNIGYVKNTPLLLSLFGPIHKKYTSTSLHVAGKVEDVRSHVYWSNHLQHTKLPCHIEGRQSNMVEWFKDKTFLINTSLIESQFLSGIEAMASGVIPIIYNWDGAESIFPARYLFTDISEGIEIFDNICSTNIVSEREYSRNYVIENFNVLKLNKRILDFIGAK